MVRSFTGGTSGTIGPLTFDITAQDVADLNAKKWYFNIHTTNFPGGEIRGQAKNTFTPFDRDGDGSILTWYIYQSSTGTSREVMGGAPGDQ